MTPPSASRVRMAALLAVFTISLDVSIVNIALPTLARDLGAPLASLQWVLDGYIAAFASLLLVTAKLSRAIGAAKAMRIGVLGFTVASAACALAPTAGALVAGRVLQGAAASLILPSGLTLVTRLAGDQQLGRALGAFSAVVGAATALGPSAGALLLTHFSWRPIFLVNLPIGMAVLWALRAAPGARGARPARIGAAWRDGALSAAGLFSLCFGLIDVGRHGWGSPPALAAIALGVAALVLFGFLQRHRGDSAVVDTGLLRHGSLVAANVATLLTFTAMMGATFLAPLVLVGLYRYSLARTAAVLSLTSVLILVVAPPSGRLVEVLRPRAVGVLGFAGVAGAMWRFAALGPRPGFGSVAVAATLLGVGIGLALPPLTTQAMDGIGPTKVEDASALFSTSRQIGLAVGVALFGSLASTAIGHELAAASVPHVPGIAHISLAQLEHATPGRTLPPEIASAIWRGLATTFRIGSGVALLAALPMLVLPRLRPTAVRDRPARSDAI